MKTKNSYNIHTIHFVYGSFDEFNRHSKIYGYSKLLGFSSTKKAWDANPRFIIDSKNNFVVIPDIFKGKTITENQLNKVLDKQIFSDKQIDEICNISDYISNNLIPRIEKVQDIYSNYRGNLRDLTIKELIKVIYVVDVINELDRVGDNEIINIMKKVFIEYYNLTDSLKKVFGKKIDNFVKKYTKIIEKIENENSNK